MIRPLTDDEQSIVMEHMNVVEIAAKRIRKTLPKHIDFELGDLKDYGVIGLIDAIGKYDKKKKVQFDTYAYRRVKGAIYDGIREMDWVSLSSRRKHKNIQNPISIEVAYRNVVTSELNEDWKEYDQIEDKRDGIKPDLIAEKHLIRESLRKVIKTLEIKRQIAICLYYFQYKNQEEISEMFGTTPSWISFLLRDGRKTMKRRLIQYGW